jgi:hypothetical protein
MNGLLGDSFSRFFPLFPFTLGESKRAIMNWPLLFAVAAAIFLPAAWGWLLYQVFTRLGLDRRLPAPIHVEDAEGARGDDAWDYQI